MTLPPVFPVAPRAFDGASRKVDAGAGFEWLRQGWAFFAAQPGVWMAAAVLTLLILIGCSLVPLVGQVAAHLLLPVLGAGLLQLCRRQAEGEIPEIADLFNGFRHHAGNLVMVGLIYALAVFAIAVLVALVVGGGIASGVVQGSAVGVGLIFSGFLLASLLIAVLATPVLMAIWFAPALVFFNAMAPLEAMKASFHACAKNWLPFFVYGVMITVLFFLSALLLGLGFLVLIPVMSGALYASYRDVFVGV